MYAEKEFLLWCVKPLESTYKPRQVPVYGYVLNFILLQWRDESYSSIIRLLLEKTDCFCT